MIDPFPHSDYNVSEFELIVADVPARRKPVGGQTVGFDRNLLSQSPPYKKLRGVSRLPLTFLRHRAMYRYSCYQDCARVNDITLRSVSHVGTFTPIIGKLRQYLFCHNCGLTTNASLVMWLSQTFAKVSERSQIDRGCPNKMAHPLRFAILLMARVKRVGDYCKMICGQNLQRAGVCEFNRSRG